MITRLKVENFTAFDSLELEFGEGIQALVGPNGSGKTHILKILYATTQQIIDGYRGVVSTGNSDRFINIFRPTNTSNLFRYEGEAMVLVFEDEFWTRLIFTMQTPFLTVSPLGHSNPSYEKKLTGSVFIPTKDILGNAKGFQSLYRLREISFEETYDDVLTRAYLPRLKNINPRYKTLLEKIEKFIGGKVESRDEEFYLIIDKDKKALEMSLISEGWRKLALLWLILQNGSLEKRNVLFWDEPEANLNPSAIPLLADILLQLSREGVQVFLATHSYVLLKELDLQKEEHPVNYHSLYFEDGEVRASTAQDYDDIQHNLIEQENVRLYHAELGYLLETDE